MTRATQKWLAEVSAGFEIIQQKREADQPHEYESERSAPDVTGPCAVCGQSYSAETHAVSR